MAAFHNALLMAVLQTAAGQGQGPAPAPGWDIHPDVHEVRVVPASQGDAGSDRPNQSDDEAAARPLADTAPGTDNAPAD